MSGKSVYLGSLVLALLALGRAQGQEPPATPGGHGNSSAYRTTPGTPAGQDEIGGAPEGSPGPSSLTPTAQGAAGHFELSNWIKYPRSPVCCGPVGANGPIGSEIYFRSGVSFAVGSGLGEILDNGWAVEGGGRVLFFNPEADAAWTVDLGVSNYHYNSSDPNTRFTLFNLPIRQNPNQTQTPNTPTTIPQLDVSVSGYNMTFGNASFGRQWYLWGSAEHERCQSNWRVGADIGGGWGTAKMDYNEIQHRTDVVGRGFVGLYSDLEVPCGCCIFQAGLRAEYDYFWSDILQSQNNADLQGYNLLGTLGIRF